MYFSQWRPGEPNNNKEGQHCVTYEGGTAYTANTFNYEPCSRTRWSMSSIYSILLETAVTALFDESSAVLRFARLKPL